ncbi:hypothetical protein TgHK011_008309 [Trichoderma gracile]|nr:hypothetical protein TgHK011_008309 [Trichoderma gracile]
MVLVTAAAVQEANRPTGHFSVRCGVRTTLRSLNQVDDAGDVDYTGRFLRRSTFHAAQEGSHVSQSHSILLGA